ncbi:hypothetical protein BDV23DRAFT_184280 [Aspergillus alliaceus]|uniref:Uncharacterized protein n=1 Tax=Petromyces alliaceus TaxID=209559 RepID=A0A5N7C6J2_PETAA|nr:hypothetical protein BDV23DRAFT_184280 [Aspergillus alliaceus]
MNDYSEIQRVIGSIDPQGEDNASDYEGANELMGTNMVASLQHRVDTLMNENIELNRRVNSMEAKAKAIYAHFLKSPERSKVVFPDENWIRDRYVTQVDSSGTNPNRNVSMKSRTDSFVDIHEDRSVSNVSEPSQRASWEAPTPSPNVNPFANYFESTRRAESIFKSNSAIAPQGYTNKGSMWGTAIVSFLTVVHDV